MLHLFCFDVAKVDRNVAHGAVVIHASEGNNRANGEASDRATIRGKKERMGPLSLFGRESQIEELQLYLMKVRISPLSVMSVWGTNGVGKSASVRNLYYRRLCDNTQLFEKYGWVDVSHPFNVRDFSQTLFQEFSSDSLEATADAMEECRKILKNHRCLVVIDGLRSKEEWDMIQAALVPGANSIIIVITTEVSIALHCTGTEEFVLNIKCLEDDAAFRLLKQEVLKKNQRSTIKDVSELRKLISMCGGLPKVIVAAAGLLATDAQKWENIASSMNAQFMHYLETKQEFASLHDLFGWMHSYFRALPDDLRQSIAYLSLFPGHCTIRRRRLVMRWVAEGYSKDNDNYTAGENGEKLFSKLVELSMIQPPRLTNTRLVSYQVSEFFREYIISRPVEENITIALEIFALKGHCYPTSQRRGRHLVIEESWHRDRIVFENIDFSRLRSLTVLGKWESFFISRSMKVLRVLDLEDASDVTNKDVEKILELLPRLKFLSLRGCRQVTHLPSSLGKLRQLQILDVRGTSIVSIPASISKLKKLQYIRAGTTDPSTPRTVVSWLAKLFGLLQLPGVKVPTGIRKMTLLHTLGIVNVGAVGGKTILKGLKNLTHLCKLGLSGISKRNSKEFCSAISCHAHLESLSLWLSNSKGDQGCYLDDISSPPENLRSLKLFGLGQGLPAWIKGLHKLTKLELDMTISPSYDIIAVLGDMKELHTLHLCVNLCVKSLQDGGDLELNFRVELNGVETPCYRKVKVLQIACRSSLGVTFGLEAMQNLELMVVGRCSESKLQFKDLNRLSPHKLKEVRVLVSNDNTLKSFETLKKDLKALQNDLKAETFKDMNSKFELNDDDETIKKVRSVRSRTNMLKDMLKDLETLKKNMETLQKNLDSQLKLNEVRLLGSRDDTLRDLETLKKDLETLKMNMETLQKNLDSQVKLMEVRLLGSHDVMLRDSETVKKDLDTKPLKETLDTLKKKLMELETLEKNLETLKMENIEELKTYFEEQLIDHPRNPAVSLEYY